MRTLSYNTQFKVLGISIYDPAVYSCYRLAIVILVLIASATNVHGKTNYKHNPTVRGNPILLRDSLSKDSLNVIKLDGVIESDFHENIDSLLFTVWTHL